MGSVLGSVENFLGLRDNSRVGDQMGGGQYGLSYLQNAVNNQGQIYGGQQNLAQALQQQMAGQGPNPAQTQFMGNSQANIANAQGMIASQRGLNPALAARMGANAAAHANQQAALGSALLQQQQQLGATQNLGNLYGQMQQGNLGQQQLFGNAYNNASGIQQKINEGNQSRNQQFVNGALGAIGGIAGQQFGKSSGGGANSTGGTPLAGGFGDAGSMGSGAMVAAHGAKVPGKAEVAGDSPKNDTVNAKLSPGEIIIPRSMAHSPEAAKSFVEALFKSQGNEKEPAHDKKKTAEFVDHLIKDGDKKQTTYGDVLKTRRKAKAK